MKKQDWVLREKFSGIWGLLDERANTVSITFTPDEPDTYTVKGTAVSAPELTDTATVTILEVELLSVFGENENGFAQLSGKMTPSTEWVSTRLLVNGVVKVEWEGSITAGDFEVWLDQNWLSNGENTITYEVATAIGSVCTDSITASVVAGGDTDVAKIVNAYWPGVGYKLYTHRVYTEYGHVTTYSIPQSGRTARVGGCRVGLFLGADYDNISDSHWHEKHEYINNHGQQDEQFMVVDHDDAIDPSETRFKKLSPTSLWVVPDGLNGVSTVDSLVYDTGVGLVVLVLSNTTIEINIE